MLLLKQWREHARHPDGVWCLIPVELEFTSPILIGKSGSLVRFTDPAYPQQSFSMDLDRYRRQVHATGCSCVAGELG